jgi:hypothetical protein|tara:strand:- start:2655 stop:2906 length:252 start_codon:yes stop_codon:yes gene_type:complete
MEEEKSPELDKILESDDSELKDILVNYIGNKLDPETDEITVEMAVEVLSDEFPELLLALAEENFIRGYKQAFADLANMDPVGQ